MKLFEFEILKTVSHTGNIEAESESEAYAILKEHRDSMGWIAEDTTETITAEVWEVE